MATHETRMGGGVRKMVLRRGFMVDYRQEKQHMCRITTFTADDYKLLEEKQELLFLVTDEFVRQIV